MLYRHLSGLLCSAVLAMPVWLMAGDAGLACTGRLVEAPGLLSQPLCLPDRPLRVVTLDPFYSLLMARDLGLDVVGTALSGGTFPVQLGAGPRPAVIGETSALDLEAVLLLKPDLIIGDAYFQAANAAQLQAIAPTALVTTADWKDYLRAVALVGGVPDRADAMLADYRAEVAELAARLPQGGTVSFLRIVPGGFQVYVDGPAAYAPMHVLSELGLKRPPFETATDDTVLRRPTLEGLPELQGDVLIYTLGGAHHEGDAAALRAEVTGSAIWQQIPAVRAGRAHEVAATHWMGFGGLASARAIMSDVRRAFGIAP